MNLQTQAADQLHLILEVIIHPLTCLLASALWQLMNQMVVPLLESTVSQEVITKTKQNQGTLALFTFLSFLRSPLVHPFPPCFV